MRRALSSSLAVAVVLLLALPSAQTRTSKTLDIYVVDVEGGNATLFVAPSGESVLIDTGNGGAAGPRDPERIMAAVRDAGLTQIDHLITKHSLFGAAKHTVAKPGDKIPITGLDWRIVTSGGQAIKSPLAGAGAPNKYCAAYTPKQPDPSENAQSVGSIITFGKFRVAHLGDLTWNKEFDLMCPTNRVGTVDLFVVSHHGQPISNSEVLVHAIKSRVAILNNGTRKGGQPEFMKIIYSAPGLEDLWQVHFSQLSGQEYTVPGMFISNPVDDQPAAMPVAAMPAPSGPGAAPPPAHNGRAYWIKVSANADGSFSVTNTRNGFSKTYSAGR